MSGTIAPSARRRSGSSKKAADKNGEVVIALPKSAVITVKNGRANIILPASQLEPWIEDQLDLAKAEARLVAERHLAVPFEEAVSRIDARKTRGGR